MPVCDEIHSDGRRGRTKHWALEWTDIPVTNPTYPQLNTFKLKWIHYDSWKMFGCAPLQHLKSTVHNSWFGMLVNRWHMPGNKGSSARLSMPCNGGFDICIKSCKNNVLDAGQSCSWPQNTPICASSFFMKPPTACPSCLHNSLVRLYVHLVKQIMHGRTLFQYFLICFYLKRQWKELYNITNSGWLNRLMPLPFGNTPRLL